MKNRIPTLEEYAVNERESRQADIAGIEDCLIIFLDGLATKNNTILLEEACKTHKCEIEILKDNKVVIIAKDKRDLLAVKKLKAALQGGAYTPGRDKAE